MIDMVERLITLNLRRYLVEQPVTKRQRKAISYIRERVAHYTKVDIDNVKIDMGLSESVIKYYSRKMKPIKLSIDVKDGNAMVKAHQDSIRPQYVQKNVEPAVKISAKNSKKEILAKTTAPAKTEKSATEVKQKKTAEKKKTE